MVTEDPVELLLDAVGETTLSGTPPVLDLLNNKPDVGTGRTGRPVAEREDIAACDTVLEVSGLLKVASYGDGRAIDAGMPPVDPA